MIDLTFDYRGATFCVVATSASDDIASRIQRQGTFYEFDVLERCEFYVKRLRPAGGLIIDAGAFIGNHTVFFANFCHAGAVIAFEACQSSFDVLIQTIARNGLNNVRAYNVALGDEAEWGMIAVHNPENLGTNRVQRGRPDQPGAVRIVALDDFLQSIGFAESRVCLMKIDVEGMECEVMRGATNTIAASKPILCMEMLDGAHMRRMLRIFRRSSYLIRECNGAAPTYLVTWESRIPRALIRLLNFGWLLLAYYGNNAWRWRYRRVIDIALPV